MMNLKVRIKQKWFWITLIPLVFLLIDQIGQLYTTVVSMTIGDALYDGDAMNLAISIIGVVFAILALIGFPVDMTTDGYGDSADALDRNEPAPNAEQAAAADIKADMKTASAKHAARK